MQQMGHCATLVIGDRDGRADLVARAARERRTRAVQPGAAPEVATAAVSAATPAVSTQHACFRRVTTLPPKDQSRSATERSHTYAFG